MKEIRDHGMGYNVPRGQEGFSLEELERMIDQGEQEGWAESVASLMDGHNTGEADRSHDLRAVQEEVHLADLTGDVSTQGKGYDLRLGTYPTSGPDN